MKPKLKILITEEQIRQKVAELAKKISNYYRKKQPLLIVGILKGSAIFLSDLIRKLTISCEVDFISVRSYDGTSSTGVVQLILDLYDNPVGKHILIVEDIIDTGRTLKFLKTNLLTRKAKSVKICVLLNKKCKRKTKIKVDYKGFDVPDKFVVGYGLDYNEKYRNLPYVAILE
ncbi:MAG: hypoxanthine phosphoribosyltransferase [Endomicrobia bacterium]|nr:hypoxanthine phosphoribosyltransferase [Endomicrobiia bacterium]MDW8056515.1 hypoxanthine phosphoribosyltransferase [Elusimicrobiota bacterium]